MTAVLLYRIDRAFDLVPPLRCCAGLPALCWPVLKLTGLIAYCPVRRRPHRTAGPHTSRYAKLWGEGLTRDGWAAASGSAAAMLLLMAARGVGARLGRADGRGLDKLDGWVRVALSQPE